MMVLTSPSSTSWQTVSISLSSSSPRWNDSSVCCCRYISTSSIAAIEPLKAAPPAEAKPIPKPPPSPPAPPPLSSSSSASPNLNSKNEEGISQIQVPRQKYIPVSKSRLLDALLSMLRSQSPSPHHNDDFLLLSSCLDYIIDAEHKRVLEEMRADYFATHLVRNEGDVSGSGVEREGIGGVRKTIGGDDMIGLEELEENQLPFLNGFDLFQLFGTNNSQKNVDDNSRASGIATATRFQRSFMKLLEDAQFEELSVRDLMLTSALNTDYLLTLPLNVDWNRAYESNAIIFRRGYSIEKQKGLLIGEKLDYLQSKILQEIFGFIAKPLLKIGLWTKEVIQNSCQSENM